MTNESAVWKLRGQPDIEPALRSKLVRDFDRFAVHAASAAGPAGGLPRPFTDFLQQEYRIDLSAEYAGLPISNPFGKASGQLSMTLQQVQEDIAVGLGFTVLKTVIAEDAAGRQMMKDWAIKEAKMTAERIVGRRSGREGWTITWKGRGWWQSFGDYLELVRTSAAAGSAAGLLVAPSCKFHLPTPLEEHWKEDEYRYTTARLCEAYAAGCPGQAMPLEKDFSPTLAGSERAGQQERILEWLRTVPVLLRRLAPRPIRVGLKLFNAMFGDELQVRMLRHVMEASGEQRPDFIVYANRLFDPQKQFEGKTGVAYGGPDLSDRNLAALDGYLAQAAAGTAPPLDVSLSGTGDVCTGRLAVEYALRGCSSLQIHTFFQLPADVYAMQSGNRTAKALHLLLFHPDEGLVAWLMHVGRRNSLVDADGSLRWRDVVGLCRSPNFRA